MSDQGSVIQGVETFTAIVSIISCLYMAMKIRREASANIANKMLTFLFALDFILAIAYVIGRSAMPIFGFCQFQVCDITARRCFRVHRVCDSSVHKLILSNFLPFFRHF